MTTSLAKVAGAAWLALTIACSGQDVSDSDDAGSGGSDAGSGGSAGTPPVDSCPIDLPGPSLALKTTPSGTSYCIDTTEVTQEQYGDFSGAGVPLTEQPHARCNEMNNDSFRPFGVVGEHSCTPGKFTPGQTPDLPVVCIDFCDAIAYCHWAGKRLCGILGRAGETLGSFQEPESDFNVLFTDPDQSQWYNACSAGGVNNYPYGQEYDPGCEGRAEVGTRPSCSTPTDPPLFDMSGNVMEWEDACDSEGDCRVRGGHSGDGAAETMCASGAVRGTNDLGEPDTATGFRCCYEF